MGNKTSGFTLLETLVALSVLAISLGIVYQVFSSSLRSSELANDYARASMYADSHIAEINEKVSQLIGQTVGSYDSRYKWRLNIQAQEDEIGRINLNSIKSYRVELDVYWDGNYGTRSIRTTTFRLGGV